MCVWFPCCRRGRERGGSLNLCASANFVFPLASQNWHKDFMEIRPWRSKADIPHIHIHMNSVHPLWNAGKPTHSCSGVLKSRCGQVSVVLDWSWLSSETHKTLYYALIIEHISITYVNQISTKYWSLKVLFMLRSRKWIEVAYWRNCTKLNIQDVYLALSLFLCLPVCLSLSRTHALLRHLSVPSSLLYHCWDTSLFLWVSSTTAETPLCSSLQRQHYTPNHSSAPHHCSNQLTTVHVQPLTKQTNNYTVKYSIKRCHSTGLWERRPTGS